MTPTTEGKENEHEKKYNILIDFVLDVYGRGKEDGGMVAMENHEEHWI